MRLIVVGCEYAGTSTFMKNLKAWGLKHHTRFHVDDHLLMPDAHFGLTDEDRRALLSLGPELKERYQRFMMYYHALYVCQVNTDIVFEGFHIAEKVYGPLYFGYQPHLNDLEMKLPPDVMLLLLKASPEVIQKRMEADPHKFQIIKKEDIPLVSKRFEEEYNNSILYKRLTIDTSNLSPEEVFQKFLSEVTIYLELSDLYKVMNK